MLPETKLSQLKQHMADGDSRAALKLAASFSQLGQQKVAITRAWNAITSPAFYREIGRNPDKLIEQGLEAIQERYGI